MFFWIKVYKKSKPNLSNPLIQISKISLTLQTINKLITADHWI